MNSSPDAKDIKMAEKYTNNSSPTTRCTRTNGRGWRCSQQCFSGYRMCEHHFIASKGCRKKKKNKNKNSSIRHKEAALKVKIAPSNATKVVQRELKNVGNSRTSRKWSDHFFTKDDDFEWISEVMDNTEAEKKIRMAENTINYSTIARCIRSNGKGWRCSEPSVAGHTMCEHHCALAKNGRRRDRKQKKKKKKTETLLQNELRNEFNKKQKMAKQDLE
ncbi:hypothetical protein ACH5RR_007475 [Cinchona calisaya]|uniref:WRC domain-containing protein n=1 Tax=Cinchona calisaya TaxID=153742 RepID=A0ABD3ARW0_9GENT